MNPEKSKVRFTSLTNKQVEEKPKSKVNFTSLTSPREEILQEPTFGQEAVRHGVRSAARVGETIAGLPGDIVGLLRSGLGYGAEKLTGNKGIREAIEKGPESITGDEFTPESIPSSGQLQQALGKATKGFTQPQGRGEALADEFISDITSLAIPVKGKIPFARAIGTAFAGNLGKEFAKEAGVDETGQFATKMGIFGLAGLIRPKEADKFVSNLYDKARTAIPEGTMIPTTKLTRELNVLEKELGKGKSTATKKQVLDDLKELENKAAGGALPLDDLVQYYHDINETMTSRKLFGELSKSEHKLLKTRFEKLKGVVKNNIEEYGQYNPEFLDNWKSANEAFGAIQQSKKVSKFIHNAIKGKLGMVGTPALVLFEVMHPEHLVKTAGAYAIGKTALSIGELTARIAKSPTLRKYYQQVVENSLKANSGAVVKDLNKINKELES